MELQTPCFYNTQLNSVFETKARNYKTLKCELQKVEGYNIPQDARLLIELP